MHYTISCRWEVLALCVGGMDTVADPRVQGRLGKYSIPWYQSSSLHYRPIHMSVNFMLCILRILC